MTRAHTPAPVRKPAGIALVTAIFLLVVLSGLAVAIVSITASQQASSVQDVQGVRAYQAAKAGAEWAMYVALRTGTQPQTSTSMAGAALGCPRLAANPYIFALPAGTSLSAFTVTVTCTAPSAGVAGGGATDTTAGHFTITSTACNGPAATACPNASPGPDYVQRSITVQL